nr:alpha-D-glucose phosphate-specific phosphoglucomutase [Blochmannia endosymbiont of Camponotus (Colobopsis) obliquus]
MKYYILCPDPHNDSQMVKFGTSGHRGTSEGSSFNENHIFAITQAIVNIRINQGITGPCYLGKDTHVLSEPAFISVIEVLTANGIDVIIQQGEGYTPTPVISHAILNYNRFIYINSFKADGIILTSSHNPPEYGGIKYNPFNGGPANIGITNLIEKYANLLLANKLRGIRRFTLKQAWRSGHIYVQDLIQTYIKNLSTVIDMKAIKGSGIRLGIDPLGGAGIAYWQYLAHFYHLNLVVINEKIDKTFSFIRPDCDGKIRMDCSSESVISCLLMLRNKFDLIFINDPDCDRHSIITSLGSISSRDYLSVAIDYLFQNRPLWKSILGVGTTLVSSTMINLVTHNLNIKLLQFPVGFKWFVQGLFNSVLGFCCEESAGASFLNFNARPWSTDKDGIIMCLLAAEITVNFNKDIKEYFSILADKFGFISYNCMQIPITSLQRKFISQNLHNFLHKTTLTGDYVIKRSIILNCDQTINCVKIITCNGWFAIRLSGTEEVYKIYCESFIDINHRIQIETEIKNIINSFLLQIN